MKWLILLTVVAFLQLSCALMSVNDFEVSGLIKCYDTNERDNRGISDRNINGQVLPLPNSAETFISIIERYESLNPNVQVKDLVEKLLKNFRIDNLRPDPVDDEVRLRDDAASNHNKIKRLLFSIPDNQFLYSFNKDDFTDDEKCALHFMLSHTVNDSRADDNDEILTDQVNKIKEPREYGVVNLYNKRKHAFALGRVLLGIYAAYLPSSAEDITSILKKDNKNSDIPELRNLKINPVNAVTLSDLIMRLAEDPNSKVLPNGAWNDISCPTEYKLEDNNGGFVTYSELRGAVDGLLIGRRIQEYKLDYNNFRLSQILRMYYGITGMPDSQRTRWCSRESHIQNIAELDTDVINYVRLYRTMHSGGSVRQATQDRVRSALSFTRDSSFIDVEKDECSISETSAGNDRKYTSPRNIFAILDYSTSTTSKGNIQSEIIGNLSADFDFRPRGNLMGVYSNAKPLQQNTLEIIVKNSGTSGCPSCFAKYYKKRGNKQDDAELFRDLNSTLTNFDEEQQQLEESYHSDIKAGSPGKIVLYFNFGGVNTGYSLENALWELRRTYGGTTILAIGDNRDNLKPFVRNDQTDIFTISPKIVQELKQRINKVPAEFTFKRCHLNSASEESNNRQEAYIGQNKIQYWAMYPQYFLKSYGIKLKFKSQEGTQIRVCFSRSYSVIIEGQTNNCKDSAGSEIEFHEKDPCKKRNVFDCEPFYFSVEGKKQTQLSCESLTCGTMNDIQFQFEHEGISCNLANYVTVSSLALLFAVLMYYIQRQ